MRISRTSGAALLFICGLAVGGISVGARSDSELLGAEMPRYLALARSGNIQGKVEIQVVTNAEGKVISAQPKSGHPLLAQSALENVKTWRFAGQSERTITFEFTIEGSARTNDDYYRYGKIVFHLPNLVEVIVPPLLVEQ